MATLKKQWVPLICFVLYFAACKNNDFNRPIHVVDTFPLHTGELSIEFDSCLIKIDSMQQEYYKVSTAKDNFYYGYNFKRSALDVFDLKSKEFKNSIPLSVPTIASIFVQSKDSIFLLSEQSITLINESGKVLKQLPINSKNKVYESFFKRNYLMADAENQNFYFDSRERRLYIHSIEPVHGTCSEKHFESPILTSVNLDSGLFNTMPIFFCNSYRENYYGFQVVPRFLFLKEKIIYNFPIDSRIFVYNKDFDSTMAFRPLSKIASNEAYPVPKKFCNNDDKKLEYFLKNAFFGNIIYCKALDQYFQFKKDAMKEWDKPKANGEYYTINDKKQFVSIFDKDLQFKADIPLPDKMRVVQNPFVVDSCIYVPAFKKGLLYFSVLKIQQ